MTRKVFKRCQAVVDKWNKILCCNCSDLVGFKLDDSLDDRFTLWLDATDRVVEICSIEHIVTGSAAVRVVIDNKIRHGLSLTINDSIVCDYSIVHLILECIFNTEAITQLLYEVRRI